MHNFIPFEMLKGEIRPIIKDRFGDKPCSSNYRPIMSSSVILKLFEHCLLSELDTKVNLNKRQFGFRKHSSCLMAVTVLKENIQYYTTNGSNVHMVSLDLSKAFDRVNHYTLISKLIDKKINSTIVNIISFMFNNQSVNVRFSDILQSSLENRKWTQTRRHFVNLIV